MFYKDPWLFLDHCVWDPDTQARVSPACCSISTKSLLLKEQTRKFRWVKSVFNASSKGITRGQIIFMFQCPQGLKVPQLNVTTSVTCAEERFTFGKVLCLQSGNSPLCSFLSARFEKLFYISQCNCYEDVLVLLFTINFLATILFQMEGHLTKKLVYDL